MIGFYIPAYFNWEQFFQSMILWQYRNGLHSVANLIFFDDTNSLYTMLWSKLRSFL